MKSILKRTLFPVILLVLLFGFWISPDFQVIAAGVAIFLFGMLMLEDGFKLFAGGALEKVLSAATRTRLRSMTFGFVAATAMQSSSLVSVITISFLSAGLVSLVGGIGIMFGADIGTTTGAWLVAGFGLKVKISTYAMPMLALAIVLVFQKSNALRGLGFLLGGLGFLLLGIHYMKEGFEAFKDQIDLTRFAMTGMTGVAVYTLIGALATVVMQSSHATMVLIITAMAAGQVSYDNALALTIGANIGTTITAVLGSLTANYQGKRLALAHVLFKLITGAVAIALIVPLGQVVNAIAGLLGIAPDDYTLKLAVFHTLFNVMGVALLTPVIGQLVRFLHRAIPETAPDISRALHLSDAVGAFPATIEMALRNEVSHLHDNAVELIVHGLNLHRHDLYAARDVEAYVASAREPFDIDMDQAYEARIKTLYAEILEFITGSLSGDLPASTVAALHNMRESAEEMVRAVKEVKHMRANTTRFTGGDHGEVSQLYNRLRTELARVILETRKLAEADPDERSVLWLEAERNRVKKDKAATDSVVLELMLQHRLSGQEGTSFLNDAFYAYRAMKDMIDACRLLYGACQGPMAEVERILAEDEDDLGDVIGSS